MTASVGATADERSTIVLPDAAAEAFASIANETRLRILLALWEAEERPVRFSDLRARVGVRDPGQFRYHLRRLEDGYVRRTPDGYDITMAGVNVVWAVLSGDVTTHPDVEPFPVDGDCESCGSTLVVAYEDDVLFVRCPSCGRVHAMTPFHASGLVGRTNDELVAVLDRVVDAQGGLIAHNVCPRCFGSGSLTLVADRAGVPVGLRTETPDEQLAEILRYAPDEGRVEATWICARCGLWAADSLDGLVRYRPEVAAFYRDHGVDVASIPAWEIQRHLGECTVTVTEEDPLSVRLDVTLDGETLSLTIASDFTTVSAERTGVSPHRRDETTTN